MTYIFLANGFEEIEALTTVDMLRRAGIQIKMVSIMREKMVYGSHGIGVEADIIFEECNFESVENICNHFDCKAALRKFAESGRYVAAICAGPMALAKARILGGHEATIYDGMESELIDAEYVKKNVVVSGNIITGRGPAYASDFASELIRILKNDDVASEVRGDMLFEA